MNKEIFLDPAEAFKLISNDWLKWHNVVKPQKYVVGISGGVDSTTCAALACKLFGKENVVGVSLPNDGQDDMLDVNSVFETLGIRRVDIDIYEMFGEIQYKLEVNGIEMSEQTRVNAPARLRMTTLYAVAQSLKACVINTCNRSESIVGYDTLFGDSCGDYSPVKMLVKTEVMKLAEWLGVPRQLAYKTPIDGLQAMTDEQRFGFTYADLDKYIRTIDDNVVDSNIENKILDMHNKSKFKLDIINVPGPIVMRTDTEPYIYDRFMLKKTV